MCTLSLNITTGSRRGGSSSPSSRKKEQSRGQDSSRASAAQLRATGPISLGVQLHSELDTQWDSLVVNMINIWTIEKRKQKKSPAEASKMLRFIRDDCVRLDAYILLGQLEEAFVFAKEAFASRSPRSMWSMRELAITVEGMLHGVSGQEESEVLPGSVPGEKGHQNDNRVIVDERPSRDPRARASDSERPENTELLRAIEVWLAAGEGVVS